MTKSDESLKTFSLPFLKGAELIKGTNICNEFRRHIHKTCIIGLVTKGSRVIQNKGELYSIGENEIFILNPGDAHSCSSESTNHSYIVLSVPIAFMVQTSSQISEKPEKEPYFRSIHYKDETLALRLKRLIKIINEPQSDIEAEAEFHTFLSCLIMEYSFDPPEIKGVGEQKDSIKRVCRFISDNYWENLSLGQLAGVACLSPFHFQREFKKNVGITPHEYISDLRISLSKKMLLESENIVDTAIAHGFFDQSHFTRVFRRSVGVSPGNFINNNRINNK